MKRSMIVTGVVLVLLMSTWAYAEYGAWTSKNLDYNYNNAMLDISAATYDDLFSVGVWTDNISTFKFVWRSNDGGNTLENIYQFIMSPDPAKMCEMLKITDARTAVHMTNPDVGLFGGSGVSQECMDQFGPDPGQQMICMIVCAMTIGPSIWFTDNGGDHFYESTIPHVMEASVQSIHMVTDTVGYAGGLGSYVIKTQDGGETWQELSGLYADDLYINKLFFIDEDTGWLAVGEWDPSKKGELEGMEKARNHFHKMMLSSNAMYRHDYWASLDPTKASKLRNGAVLKTTDGGDTWEVQVQGGSEGYDFIHFVDKNHGWLIGDEYTTQGNLLHIYRTDDGGENWNEVTNSLPDIPGLSQGWYPTGVQFINPGFGIMYGVGAKFISYNSAMLYTTDGGDTWTVDDNAVALNGGQFAFDWVDNTTAFSGGLYLNVMKYEGTNDGPTADAGEDFVANVGTPANLDGTGSSDPDNDGLFYSWEQVSGVEVDLDDATLATPSFNGTDSGYAIFQLVVNDGMYDSDADEVEVAILPAGVDDDITDDDVDDDTDGDDDDDDDDDNGSDDDDDDDGCGC